MAAEDTYVTRLLSALSSANHEAALARGFFEAQYPDVVLFDNNTFPDLYKAMDSGTFADLEPYMEADSTFDASQYLPTLLNAGVYKEQRQRAKPPPLW